MSEVKRWSGNVTTSISLYDDELDKLAVFFEKYESIYIVGKGHIGNAIKHYCEQAGFKIDGMITSYEIEQISYKSCGFIIGVGSGLEQEVITCITKYIDEKQIFVLSTNKRENMGKSFDITKVSENFWINVFVTNSCNLFCRSCSTFSPVCNETYYKFDDFKKDIKRLSEMHFNSIAVIKFTGGEAMLHPDIFSFFSYAREVFPEIPFECYTNGTTLIKMSDTDLERLKEYCVVPVITEYPVEQINYGNLYDRLNTFGVDYEVIFSDGEKKFSKRPLNLKKDTPRYLFYQCPRYKMCDSVFLFEGKIYKCVYALSSKAFNKAFSTNLVLDKNDYVDIYNNEANDVYEYCMRRIPFCGYCSPIEELVEWGLSSRKVDEWI